MRRYEKFPYLSISCPIFRKNRNSPLPFSPVPNRNYAGKRHLPQRLQSEATAAPPGVGQARSDACAGLRPFSTVVGFEADDETSRRLCMGEAYPVQRKTAVVTLSDIRQSGNNPCGKRAGAPLRGCSCSISDSLRTGRRPVGSALSHQFSYLLRGGHRTSDAAVLYYRKHKVNPWNRRNDR